MKMDRKDELLLLIAVSGEIPSDWIGRAVGSESVSYTHLIQDLHIFFSLLIPDMSHEEKQLLDEALVLTYQQKGITHENESLDVYKRQVPGCVREVVYYNQGEEPWASLSYGGSTIRTSGCGPTALAIVISTLTGEQITPEMTAQYAMDTGGYVSGRGTSHAYPANAARNWGLSVELSLIHI